MFQKMLCEIDDWIQRYTQWTAIVINKINSSLTKIAKLVRLNTFKNDM